MTKHVYLVGYLHDKGYGRAVLRLEQPIDNELAIVDADRLLTEKNGFTCSIFTYQLIEVTQ